VSAAEPQDSATLCRSVCADHRSETRPPMIPRDPLKIGLHDRHPVVIVEGLPRARFGRLIPAGVGVGVKCRRGWVGLTPVSGLVRIGGLFRARA
jgi:hypothetical protein